MGPPPLRDAPCWLPSQVSPPALVESTPATVEAMLFSLVRSHSEGCSVEDLKQSSEFGSFVALIPAPLGIGTLETEDGRQVKGFICEGWAIGDATDITALGGWRHYIRGLSNA